MRALAAVAVVLAALACAPRADTSPNPTAQDDAKPKPASGVTSDDIAGSWRIVSVNGAAPRSVGEDGGRQRTPRISFSPISYGGTSGCNFFGGLGLLEEGRYYAAPGGQTAMGCGDLTAQEDAVTGVFWGAPRVDIRSDGTLTLASAKHRITLRRDASLTGETAAWGNVEPPVLAGSSWRIQAMDGEWPNLAGRAEARILRFEADSWSGTAACATLSGGWKQQHDRILLTGRPSTTEQLCPPAQAAIDSKLAALMAARPRFVTGPNGEILIGGGDHWLVGERKREAMSNNSALIAGAWRVAAIDARPPAAGSNPELRFGPAGYTGTTGCNSIQGLFLAHRGRLFTHPGPQTEQGCAELTQQEERITGLLAASPSVAAANNGAMALVDRSGMLLLRREGAAAAQSVPRAVPTPASLRADLYSLNRTQLRRRATDPEAWIRLAPQSWELRVGCVHLGGVLRRRGAAMHFFTDTRPMPIAGCSESQGELGQRLMKMMNGEARVLTGVNGEFLLAGDDHWLTGELERGAGRR